MYAILILNIYFHVALVTKRRKHLHAYQPFYRLTEESLSIFLCSLLSTNIIRSCLTRAKLGLFGFLKLLWIPNNAYFFDM